MPGRHPLSSEPSLPIIPKGLTSLRGLAGLGLSNFQLLQCLMALVFVLHAADGAMLPAVFKALEEGLHGATPVSLGVIVMWEALCHSLAVCIWGVLADRNCKLSLLKYAMLSWGVLTLATAFVRGIASLTVIRALAGAVGAALGPLSQGLIGAVCPANERGRAFGFLIACDQAGHLVGLLLAGATSHLDATSGWRGSFVLFSLLTLGLTWIVAQVQTEVAEGLFAESQTWQRLLARKAGPSVSPWRTLTEITRNFAVILHRRSFLVLVMQGAFASTTVKAMQFQVMWLQYLGFSDFTASAITCTIPLGCIFGAVASGYVSDALAGWYPDHGRIAMGQLTELAKLLVLLVIFAACGLPDADSSGSVLVMAGLSLLFGFVSIMAYSSVVKPLYAEIVPPQMLAQVIGFAACIDGAFSSFASTPVVGFITQHVFHYQETTLPIDEMPEKLRNSNAAALGRSIAAVAVGSTMVTVIFFGLLHFTYPKDRDVSTYPSMEGHWGGAPNEAPGSRSSASSNEGVRGAGSCTASGAPAGRSGAEFQPGYGGLW